MFADQKSPVTTPAFPVTACEAIASPPSVTSVQFGPSGPSARLKLSEADVDELAVQETATLVTLAAATVPDPAETAHDCPDGFVFTVTL